MFVYLKHLSEGFLRVEMKKKALVAHETQPHTADGPCVAGYKTAAHNAAVCVFIGIPRRIRLLFL